MGDGGLCSGSSLLGVEVDGVSVLVVGVEDGVVVGAMGVGFVLERRVYVKIGGWEGGLVTGG